MKKKTMKKKFIDLSFICIYGKIINFDTFSFYEICRMLCIFHNILFENIFYMPNDVCDYLLYVRKLTQKKNFKSVFYANINFKGVENKFAYDFFFEILQKGGKNKQ